MKHTFARKPASAIETRIMKFINKNTSFNVNKKPTKKKFVASMIVLGIAEFADIAMTLTAIRESLPIVPITPTSPTITPMPTEPEPETKPEPEPSAEYHRHQMDPKWANEWYFNDTALGIALDMLGTKNIVERHSFFPGSLREFGPANYQYPTLHIVDNEYICIYYNPNSSCENVVHRLNKAEQEKLRAALNAR